MSAHSATELNMASIAVGENSRPSHRTRWNRWLASAGLAFAALTGSRAEAGVDFCNKFRVPVFVSVAYQSDGVWMTTGWQEVKPGGCSINPFNLTVDQFYYRGETDRIPKSDGGAWQETWGRQVRFSVTNAGFTFRNADQPRRGARFEPFTASIREVSGPLSVTVTFEADGIYVTQLTHPKKTADPSPTVR